MYREYGVDLRQLFVPGSGVDPFLVLSLTHQLPPHCRFMTEHNGIPDAYGWDVNSLIITRVLDEVAYGTYVMQALKADKKHRNKIPVPKPTTTPFTKKREEETKEPNKFTSVAAEMIAAARSRREANVNG